MIDKIQFFDRENGCWTEMFSPLVGFTENFVLDETTDTASVSFLWKHAEKPEFIKHLGWVRFFHFENDESQIAKYQDGLPYNHNQYLIGDYSMVQSGVNNYWKIDLQLEEPIIRAKWIQTELLTFTNQTEKTVNYSNNSARTYTREPYNHYTSLERLLKVTPCNCDNYGTGYDWKQNKSWFNRLKITEADKEWLKSIPFGGDTWSAADLYVNLMKYLKTTGRVPVFYFDIDHETDLPYNLDRDEYELRFLVQDGSDSERIPLSTLTEHASKVAYSSKLSNFATGIVSNVENMSINEKGSTVPYGLWLVPEINSNERDLTGYNTVNSGWCLDLKYKIKKIEKIERYSIQTMTDGHDSINGNARITKGLEKYVYEIKQYNALSNEILELDELFYYTEGDSKLYIKNYKKTEVNTFATNWPEASTTFIYYVEFQAMLNASVLEGEYEFCLPYNSADSQSDAFKLSSQLGGYLDAMNKPDLIVCKKVRNLKDMCKVGTIVLNNQIPYIISCASYQNINFSYLVAYQLNAFNPRRNSRVKASETIKKNMSVDYQNLSERLTCDEKIFKLSKSQLENTQSLIDKVICVSPFTNSKCPFNIGIFSSNYVNGNSLNLFIGYKPFCLKNSLGLNFKFLDNGTAGKSKQVEEVTSSGTTSRTRSITTNPSSQIPVIYKNEWGEIDKFKLELAKINVSNYTGSFSATIFTPNDEAVIRKELLDNTYLSMLKYPEIGDDVDYQVVGDLGTINYLGDMAEELNYTLYIKYQTDNDIILLPGFYKYNCICYNSNYDKIFKISYYDKYLLKTSNINNNDKITTTIKINEEQQYIEIQDNNLNSNHKSCVLWINDEPAIIINNIVIGYQKIYYN